MSTTLFVVDVVQDGVSRGHAVLGEGIQVVGVDAEGRLLANEKTESAVVLFASRGPDLLVRSVSAMAPAYVGALHVGTNWVRLEDPFRVTAGRAQIQVRRLARETPRAMAANGREDTLSSARMNIGPQAVHAMRRSFDAQHAVSNGPASESTRVHPVVDAGPTHAEIRTKQGIQAGMVMRARIGDDEPTMAQMDAPVQAHRATVVRAPMPMGVAAMPMPFGAPPYAPPHAWAALPQPQPQPQPHSPSMAPPSPMPVASIPHQAPVGAPYAEPNPRGSSPSIATNPALVGGYVHSVPVELAAARATTRTKGDAGGVPRWAKLALLFIPAGLLLGYSVHSKAATPRPHVAQAQSDQAAAPTTTPATTATTANRPGTATSSTSSTSSTTTATTATIATTTPSSATAPTPAPADSASALSPSFVPLLPAEPPVDVVAERRVAEAMFAGDYAKALDECGSLAAAHPSTPRYGVMLRVLRAKTARVRK